MKNKVAEKVWIIIISIAVLATVFTAVAIKVSPNQTAVPEKTSELTAAEPETEEETTRRIPSEVEFLVNSENPIPDDWEPDLVELKNGHKVDRHAYEDLQNMLDDARKLGYNPLICSSYRTNEKQTTLFNNKVEKYKEEGYSEDEAVAQAAKWVAYPGTSEHQTGLALDIVTVENQILDESQLNSECQKWLMEHCWDYGFILRYPADKKEITKIDFEPWHYRYVGKEAAALIKEKGICLEEFTALSNEESFKIQPAA